MDLWSLALGTLGGAAAVRGLGHLREHRVAPSGLADLVNWAFMVEDGVVLQKDGSLLAGWRYQGPDLSAATPEELDALSGHVNDALLPSTDDWMFHVDAIRRPAVAYAPAAFPDPVTQLIDDERRAAYAAQASRQFETEYFLVGTPPRGAYLNVVLADQELVGGFEPRIGRMAVRAVAVQGYPHASHAGQGDFLNALPFAFRWSHRVIPLGTHAAAKQIRRHQLQWFKKRKGAAAWVQEIVGGKRGAAPRADEELWLDQDARNLAQDAADAGAENASGAVRFCCFTQVAIVMDPDAARADLVAGWVFESVQ